MARRSSTPAITAASIKRAPLRDRRYDVTDGTGLILRVETSGRKTLRYQIRSLDRVLTIGPWSEHPTPGFVTLSEAREWLARLRGAHQAGKLADVEAQLIAEVRPKAKKDDSALVAGGLTVRKSVEQFVEYLKRERRRPEQAERIFKFDVLGDDVRPNVADLPLPALTEEHVRALVERVVARGSPVMAQHVLALLKQWLRFEVDGRRNLAASPAEGFRNPRALGAKKAAKGKRYLAAEEIAPFWKATEALGPTVRNAARLLLLTGVRTGALLGARWEEVNLDAGVWTVPPERLKLTKARAEDAPPYRVPLAPAAVDLLKELRAYADMLGSPWVLASPVKDDKAISEKAINHAVRALFKGDPPALTLPGGRVKPHDLRRTLRTHAEMTLGYPEALCERLLGHARPGVIDTYAAGDDLARRREALHAWADLVVRLVRGETGKVVPITAAVRS